MQWLFTSFKSFYNVTFALQQIYRNGILWFEVLIVVDVPTLLLLWFISTVAVDFIPDVLGGQLIVCVPGLVFLLLFSVCWVIRWMSEVFEWLLAFCLFSSYSWLSLESSNRVTLRIESKVWHAVRVSMCDVKCVRVCVFTDEWLARHVHAVIDLLTIAFYLCCLITVLRTVCVDLYICLERSALKNLKLCCTLYYIGYSIGLISNVAG